MTRLTHRNPIRFRFKFEKALAVVGYLASKLGPLDKLKLSKLVYLADRQNVVAYGFPITGDQYVALDYGPVPSTLLGLLDDEIDRDSRPEMPGRRDSLVARMEQVLECDRKPNHPLFQAKPGISFEVLSESELDSLNKVVTEFGGLSGGKLIDVTHGHEAWKRTFRTFQIDYRLFFLDAPDAKPGALEYMEMTQEDRDLEFDLNND